MFTEERAFLTRVFIICPLLLMMPLPEYCWSQAISQTISGTIVDQLSRKPLTGVAVIVNEAGQGTSSDSAGNFSITVVPVGRHSVTCRLAGYEPYTSEAFILSSGRQAGLSIEMREKITDLDPVTIVNRQNQGKPLNDFAFVSARSFTAEETERIPASVNDPLRMALAYPGIKQGRDESENKILIRGNSPFGMLWRLEGIDIPGPNHFAIPGSGGAGISILSSQLLSRSDFFSGGMPAEYGNSISGALDINFREGSKETRQHRIRIGLVGADLSTEGPIKKGRSSYLVNYRYSTLGLLSQMGFYLVGERVVNYFQDLSFNLAFRGKNGKSDTRIFGIGGLSYERYQPVKNPAERVPGLTSHWEERFKPANLGIYGIRHSASINERSSVRYVVAVTGSDIRREYDTLDLADARFRYTTESYKESRIAGAAAYNYGFSARTRFKAGVILNHIWFDFRREVSLPGVTRNISGYSAQTSVSGRGSTQTAQGYASVTHEFKKGFTIQTGLHFMRLFLNKTASAEPRISLKYNLKKAGSLGFAYGWYSQMLPMSAYFYTRNDTVAGEILQKRPNFNLKFPRSDHFILSYHHFMKNDWKITAEVYCQLLKKIPVENLPGSSYYMLNQSDGFPETPAVSKGKGRNAGLDLGVEKYFSKKYYVLISGSVFNSEFKTLTGKYLNSAFNDRFCTALTAGREFGFANGAVLQLGIKSLYSGGSPYTPLEVSESAVQGRYILMQNQDYSLHLPNYFRIDSRVSFRTNSRKRSTVWSLDVQNVTNKINVTSIRYNPVLNVLEHAKSGVGLVPVLSYQLDF